MPVHAHLERIPVRIRRLEELAVREPHELLQMLRLPRFVRKGRAGGEQDQRREQADEMMGHLAEEWRESPLGTIGKLRGRIATPRPQ